MAVFIIGIISSIFSFFTFLSKKKIWTLIIFIITNLLLIAQYAIQGYLTEILITIIAIIKNIIYIMFYKKNIKPNIYVIIIFELLLLFTGIFTWKNWFSLLFMASSMITTFATWQNNMTIMRILCLIAYILSSINYICTGLYTQMISRIVNIVSVVIGIICYDILKKEKKNNSDA